MKIEIKKVNRKDFNKVIDFAITGMHFDRYIDNALALRLYGRYFLYLELERATKVIAAYMKDKIVGILIADMNNEPKLYKSFWRNAYVNLFKTIMKVCYKGGSDMYEQANKTMLNDYLQHATPDGEICFLAADPHIQGKGIGTLLLNELKSSEKNKLIYLYTDNNCTYQFYERKGFQCSEKKKLR